MWGAPGKGPGKGPYNSDQSWNGDQSWRTAKGRTLMQLCDSDVVKVIVV